MGKFTLNDDDSDNSGGEQDGSQWDDDDVVMQDVNDEDEDEHDGDDEATNHNQSRPQSSSFWSRALTTTSNGQGDQDDQYHQDSITESQQSSEEREVTGQQPLSFQIVGRAENGDLVPFHYHVYGHGPNHNHDMEGDTRKSGLSTFTSCGWMLISLIAVVAHICYWYGPSVPPPLVDAINDNDTTATTTATTTSWHEFLSQEAIVVWALVSKWVAIIQYVGYWCFEAMSRESWNLVQSLQTHTNSAKNTTATPTTVSDKMSLDCHAPWRWDMNQLNQQVQGQEMAIDKLRKIFDEEWNADQNDYYLKHHHHQDHEPPHRVETTDKMAAFYPLVFYAVGGPAVGKKQLARSLARQFHGKDCSETDTSPVLLEVNSDDEPIGDGSPKYQAVLDHVLDHPNGSIVLWPLEETDRSKSQVISFLRELHLSPTDIFSKTIIVMTSKIGNPTIQKVLRKYGRHDLPLLELETFLRYELIEAYDASKKVMNNGVASAVQDQTSLFSHVHILTMLPLHRDAMRSILLQRLQAVMRDQIISSSSDDNGTGNTRKFHVPQDALEYMLDHGLDWKQWIHAKTDQLLLEFCPDGARAVDPLLLRIASSCQLSSSHQEGLPSSMPTTTTTTTSTLLLLDKNMGKFEMITCPSHSDTLEGCIIDCQFVL